MKKRKFLLFLSIVPVLASCTISFSNDYADLENFFSKAIEGRKAITDLQEKKNIIQKLIDATNNVIKANNYTVSYLTTRSDHNSTGYNAEYSISQKREHIKYSTGFEVYAEEHQENLIVYSRNNENLPWVVLYNRKEEFPKQELIDPDSYVMDDTLLAKTNFYKNGEFYTFTRVAYSEEAINKNYSEQDAAKIKELLKDANNELEFTFKLSLNYFFEGYHISGPNVYKDYSTGEYKLEMGDNYARITNINLTFVKRPEGVEIPPKDEDNSSQKEDQKEEDNSEQSGGQDQEKEDLEDQPGGQDQGGQPSGGGNEPWPSNEE